MPRIEGLTTSATLDGAPLLQGLSLHLEAGEIHGLLGPAGAGKTLLALALSGLVPLAAGTVTRMDGTALRVTTVPADAPPMDLTVNDLARLTGADKCAVSNEVRSQNLASMQRGARQRTLAVLLASRAPGLLVVDDPDFESAQELKAWRVALAEIQAARVPVLLASRAEVPLAALCSWMHILFDGRLIASGRTDALVPGAVMMARKRYAC